MKKNDDEVNRRGTAIMIGSIASFEKYFGYLWGHHKSDNEPLTDSEEQFLDLWETTRTEILDKGNSQIKLLKKSVNRRQNYGQ